MCCLGARSNPQPCSSKSAYNFTYLGMKNYLWNTTHLHYKLFRERTQQLIRLKSIDMDGSPCYELFTQVHF